MVQLLLEKGADVDAKADDGGTALYRAAGSGHEAVVRLLLEKGAYFDVKIADDAAVLHCAAGNALNFKSLK
jgi:ankyrin repeat protein